MFSASFFLLPAALATLALARTDLTGCTSTDVSSPAGASVAWYVPGTGELCDFLDCGGGTAPPKTTVPGCPLYSGTSTYSPSYMPGYGSATAAASSSWSEVSSTSAPTTSTHASSSSSSSSSTSTWADWSAWETDSASSSWDLYTSATGASASISATWASASSSSLITNDSTATPLICAIASSGCVPTSMSTSTLSATTASTTQTTQSPATNGSTASAGATGAFGNGTSISGTPSPSTTLSTAGAAETARAWMGSAGLVMGLGAIVAAL